MWVPRMLHLQPNTTQPQRCHPVYKANPCPRPANAASPAKVCRNLSAFPSTPSLAMAVKKLNPVAPPFHCSSHHHHLPPPPLPVPLYHVAACPPHFPYVTTYCRAPFPIPAPHHPLLPAPCPPPFLFERVPVLPAPPHSRPPHKLMVSSGAVAAKKPQAQAAAKARVAMKAWQEPPAAGAAPRPRRVVVSAPCGLRVQQQAVRGRSKEYRPRQVAPGACTATARSPPPEFTTGPPVPVRAAARLRWSATTVMVRNIPNKLTHCEMTRLLDDHCARANKRRGAVLSAYDFLYVPMDFGRNRSSNMGYAFVNFTTAEAALRLQNSLNGCHWKVFGSQKIIDVRAARIQGKDALVKHFSRSTFACRTDEFLPAVFSPPRDGAAADPKPKRVGNRVPPLLR